MSEDPGVMTRDLYERMRERTDPQEPGSVLIRLHHGDKVVRRVYPADHHPSVNWTQRGLVVCTAEAAEPRDASSEIRYFWPWSRVIEVRVYGYVPMAWD